jgi:hypothetical protein
MSAGIDFAGYELWAKQFFSQGTKGYETTEDGSPGRTYTTYTPAQIDTDIRTALRLVTTHIEQKDLLCPGTSFHKV